MAACGLAGFTFHDMRHTAVSLWVAAGASDLEEAKWAGHRSAAFTKSRYAHFFHEHGEALVTPNGVVHHVRNADSGGFRGAHLLKTMSTKMCTGIASEAALLGSHRP